MKKTIIEIVGLPGSGKSYIANELKNNKIKNCKILDEEEFYQKCREISIAKKIFYSIILFPTILKIKKLLLAFEREQNIKETLKEENRKFVKYYILQKMILKHSNQEIVLFDQWNIQFIISTILFSNKPIAYKSVNLEKLIKLLVEDYNYVFLHYDVDPNTSAKQASSRENKFRMDNMSVTLLSKYYTIHHNDYKKVGEYYFGSDYHMFKNLSELGEIVGTYV